MLIKKIYYLFLLFLSFVFTQDPPQGFEYNQGFNQSFYFFLDLNIDGEPLSERIGLVLLKLMMRQIKVNVIRMK